MVQMRKKFSNDQVRELIERYMAKKVGRKYVQEILGIKKTQFFALVEQLKEDPENFSISYARKTPTRRISPATERTIVKELKKEKDLIENKDTPITCYNYSYIQDILKQDYGQQVSLPTIIDRAKKGNFYFPRLKRKTHDREIATNYPGQLIQHDSSHHQFSPYAAGKWYLITSLDDYSRLMEMYLPKEWDKCLTFTLLILYAVLVAKETSWEHILALEYVLLNYGIPLSYYVDRHSVFRFVQGRDSY